MKQRNNNNNNFDRKPEYWESMTKKRRGLFALTPLISPLLIMAVVLGLYYYLILVKDFFPDWQVYIYWGVKVILAFEILAISARTLWGPILALAVGIGLLLAEKTMALSYVTPADSYQLIAVAVVGFLVTIIVKL